MYQPSARTEIRQLMEAGDFPPAFSLAQDSLAKLDAKTSTKTNAQTNVEDWPEQKRERLEVLYLSACCARYLGDIKTARARLASILEIEPFLGRVFLEEGHLFRMENKAREAMSCYQRAGDANPALVAAWREQVKIFEASNLPAPAAYARAQLDYHEALPPPLLRAKHLLYEGRLAKAEETCKAFMRRNPHQLDGMQLLAEIFSRCGSYEEAEFLLQAALARRPDDGQLMTEYLLILRKQQKFTRSAEVCEKLVALAPDNIAFQFHHAVEDMQAGKTEQAIATVNHLIKRDPYQAALHVLLGHLYKAKGDETTAISHYRRAMSLRKDCGEAFYALANLKTYCFVRDEMIVMQALLDENRCAMEDRVYIHFSLGAGYEKQGAYEQSFAHYQAGNAAKRSQSRYTAEGMHNELKRQEEICTGALFTQQAGQGYAAPDPIFIVGLPRAGSTLIEQILASHSQIDGTLELPNILSIAHSLRGRANNRYDDSEGYAYPTVLGKLSGDELAALGRKYIDETRIHRQGAPFFTDKMPNNFRHIGLIHLILPNAKIIDARRNPMDCCFSGFKQLFAQGQEFTYGLEEIGRYYADYVDLMKHWHSVLPGKILPVQHEDVLNDLEGQVRRMLDYLGLPFEEACLSFHKTERVVRTASAAQVRRPINREGLNAWRSFAPWLDPLKHALGSHYQANDADRQDCQNE